MKLIIQIPCFNEEATLPATLHALPRKLDGVDEIEFLIVDDGSTDRTAEVARASGVHHLVQLPTHQGLARAFAVGIEEALRLGADVIATTDADNQYCGADLARLVGPILEGKADLVIGDRQLDSVPHFSRAKVVMQKLGSWVVRVASGTQIADAASGFRAFRREVALKCNIFSRLSYTLEMIILSGHHKMAILSVPVRINPPTRPSRLFRHPASFVMSQALTILRVFMIYQPFKFFGLLGLAMGACGIALGLRFLYFFALGHGQGHVQSLILAAMLIIIGFQLGLMGLVAELIAVNRKLLEEIQFRLRSDRPRA